MPSFDLVWDLFLAKTSLRLRSFLSWNLCGENFDSKSIKKGILTFLDKDYIKMGEVARKHIISSHTWESRLELVDRNKKVMASIIESLRPHLGKAKVLL